MSATRSRRRRWIELGLAVVVMAGIVAWAEGLLEHKVGPEQVLAPVAQRHDGPTATVEARLMPIVLEAIGTVQPLREAAVSARVMGVIERLEVEEGARVRRGDLLALLSTPELAARSRAAGSAVAGARASLAQARGDLARIEALFRKDAATKVEFELAGTAVAVSEAGLARAAETAAAEAVYASYARVLAPIDGVVVERRLNPGDLASPGTTILRLADDTSFRLEAAVEERAASRLAVGTVVEVRIDALDLEARAPVSDVVPAADPMSRTVLIKVDLSRLQGLRSGLFGRVKIQVGERTGLVVSARALRQVGGLDLVRVVGADGALASRHVRAGSPVEPDSVEILAGLAAGERLALEAQGNP